MNENAKQPVVDPKTVFWNRVQLIMILVVFTAPIAGAFLYKPKSFNNYGDIYQPVRPVENLIMQGAEGPVEMDSLRRQWVFLVTANTSCDEACEANILKMRQLRFMQNNDMSRIRTVFLTTQMPPAVSAELAAKYSPVEVYSAAFNDYDEWTRILKIEGIPAEAQHNRFYIIDPAGNLMMSYPATADPAMIKKDIKRLLKASQIG
ncbi:MAG: hypothetical protein HKN50_00455 [Gammaproteobacteria bacterium]|nr:hypothetical protein [Gammaproteobacteria bacterium]